jgi:hypothetical protein
MKDDRKLALFSRLFSRKPAEAPRQQPVLAPKPWQLGLGPMQFQDHDVPTLVPNPVAKPLAAPVLTADECTLVPVTRQQVDKAAPAPRAEDEGVTLVPAPRAAILPAGRLRLTGLALPRPESLTPPAGWQIHFDTRGRIVEDPGQVAATLYANLGDRRARCRLPADGASPPRQSLAAPPDVWRDTHIGLLWLAEDGPVVELPADGAVLFGRATSEGLSDCERVDFPNGHCGQIIRADGVTVGLQQTLSRRHLMLWLQHGQLHARTAKAGTAVWKLDANRQVMEVLHPDDKGQLSFSPGDHLVAGCLILRFDSHV